MGACDRWVTYTAIVALVVGTVLACVGFVRHNDKLREIAEWPHVECFAPGPCLAVRCDAGYQTVCLLETTVHNIYYDGYAGLATYASREAAEYAALEALGAWHPCVLGDMLYSRPDIRHMKDKHGYLDLGARVIMITLVVVVALWVCSANLAAQHAAVELRTAAPPSPPSSPATTRAPAEGAAIIPHDEIM